MSAPLGLATEQEYDEAQDELERKAYQAGILYARLRVLRRTEPYPAPQIIIDHEQERLDVLADRVSVLFRAVVDWDVAHNPDDA